MPPQTSLPRSAGSTEEEMIYQFRCQFCEVDVHLSARPFHPPRRPKCVECECYLDRVFGCQIDTSGCKDHGFVPEGSRVIERDLNYDRKLGVKKERLFDEKIKQRRAALADGGNRGSFRHTHSVPAELYHGKIKETGDRDYWNDPKNMARHRNTKVD